MDKNYRNFVGDPFLECCGRNAVEAPIEAKERKTRAFVGLGMTALMFVGLIALASFAYKKVK